MQAVTSTRDGDVVVWEVAARSDNDSPRQPSAGSSRCAAKLVRLHHGPIRHLCSCGELLVSGGDDGFVRFYDSRWSVGRGGGHGPGWPPWRRGLCTEHPHQRHHTTMCLSMRGALPLAMYGVLQPTLAAPLHMSALVLPTCPPCSLCIVAWFEELRAGRVCGVSFATAAPCSSAAADRDGTQLNRCVTIHAAAGYEGRRRGGAGSCWLGCGCVYVPA